MQISLKCSSWSNSQYSGIGLEKWLGDDRATSHYLNQWWLDHWHMYTWHGIKELLSAYQKFPIIWTEPKWNIPYILDIWYNGVNGNNLPIVNSMMCKTSNDTKYNSRYLLVYHNKEPSEACINGDLETISYTLRPYWFRNLASCSIPR